jgi:hypothetical protein
MKTENILIQIDYEHLIKIITTLDGTIIDEVYVRLPDFYIEMYVI